MPERDHVYGPTYEEMLHPDRIPASIRERAARASLDDPLDPVNLFNITWKDAAGQVRCLVLEPALTGVDANIIVLYGNQFPTGSHKVGATYSNAMEMQLDGLITPGQHTLVWPSTGNYGIGGAWVGPRMGYESLVILPEMMSRERFEQISLYGAQYIKTPGCESNVKEIYDKCWELKEDPSIRVVNQFELMANYRFHYHVTGHSIAQAVTDLALRGIGNGRVAAFVSSMGSSGTIAAGDLLKQLYGDCRIVGLEPVQCPTLFENGYGGHDIQGIGDKHVTWIHNVLNMDDLMCIDDIECKKGLQLLTDPRGQSFMVDEAGMSQEQARQLSTILGISGICNILGAIKTARAHGLGREDNIVTIATDGIDRYGSVMDDMEDQYGAIDETRANTYLESIFHNAGLDWIQEGTRHNRQRWFNLKYYTWVEQQGKTVEELNAQRDPGWWVDHQGKVADFDCELRQARGF